MSGIRVYKPAHIPRFSVYSAYHGDLVNLFTRLGLDTFPRTDDYILNSWFNYTDIEGLSKILPDLAINSSLYKLNVRDCDWYALKAQVICHERYELTSFRMCVGLVPYQEQQVWHGFNIVPYGEGKLESALLFEPNDGFEWAGNAFPIGKNGYEPKSVFIAQKRR